jgi:hypothetical protein
MARSGCGGRGRGATTLIPRYGGGAVGEERDGIA